MRCRLTKENGRTLGVEASKQLLAKAYEDGMRYGIKNVTEVFVNGTILAMLYYKEKHPNARINQKMIQQIIFDIEHSCRIKDDKNKPLSDEAVAEWVQAKTQEHNMEFKRLGAEVENEER